MIRIINPKYYYSLFIELIRFLIKPEINKGLRISQNERIINTIILLIIKFIFIITSSFIAKIVITLLLEMNANNVGFEKMEKLYSPLVLLFIVSIIGPFMEEFGFRLSLRFKPIYLSFSISILSYFFITKSIYQTYNTDLGNEFFLRVLISVFLGIITFFISNKNKNIFQNFWKSNFSWLFYLSILSFGFIHILNYDLSLKVLLLMPLITLPQIISGAIYGFIRVNYGFIFNLLAHVFTNFAIMMTSVFL